MDHKYISELDVIERYLLGKLAAEEIAGFEDHFVDCSQCIEQLKTTKAFIDGLRTVATAQIVETHQHWSRNFSSWFRSMSFRWSFALLAGLLALGSVSAAVFLSNEARRWRNVAEDAKNASLDSERRYQVSERDLENKLAQLQEDIQREKTKENVHDLSTLRHPAINLPILVLRSTRGTEPSAATPTIQLTLRSSDEAFVLSMGLEGEESRSSYRMTIRKGNNNPIWKRSGLRPDQYNSLVVGFPSDFLRPGDYLLTLEKDDGNDGQRVVGRYSFRVVKTP